jgi:transcriptional pleiotropic regulator of transition state genes
MKIRGVIRQLDPVGRVVIPIEFRNLLDLKAGDPIEIILKEDSIELKKFTEASCTFCGSKRGLKEFKGKYICSRCLKALK